MKIQAINNTNFKGLFTNKSTNDNWRMEYSPYSWENNNTSTMAPKEKLNVYASKLPDNEEIFTPLSSVNNRASSKDIFGTESYFEDATTGKIRKTISEVNAMNREESLGILNKKLDRFLSLKDDEISLIKNNVEYIRKCTDNHEKNFNIFYNDSQEGYFDRTYSLKRSSNEMKQDFDNVRNNTVKLYNNFHNYMNLKNSMDDIKNQKSVNESEIKLLKDLRSKNQLIDISRRDIYDPNKALWEALQDIKKAANKYVCLPHKTISIEEILKSIGQKVKSADIPQKAIEYVDTLIKNSI